MSDLSVVAPSDSFHGFLIDLAKLVYFEISFVSLQQVGCFSSRLLSLFRNDHIQCQCYNYLEKFKLTAFQ